MLTPDHPRRRLRGLAAATVHGRRDAGSRERHHGHGLGRRRDRYRSPCRPCRSAAHASTSCARWSTTSSLANDALVADNSSLQQTIDSALGPSATACRRRWAASTTSTTRSRPTASCSSSCARACPRRDRRQRPSWPASAAWRCRPTRRGWASWSTASTTPRRPSSTGVSASSTTTAGVHRRLHRHRRQRLRQLHGGVPLRGADVGRQPPRRPAHHPRPALALSAGTPQPCTLEPRPLP